MTFSDATYFFAEIEKLHDNATQTAPQKAGNLYLLFVELLREATREAQVSFSGTFSRLHYVCQQLEVPAKTYRKLNDFRVRILRQANEQQPATAQHFQHDLRLVAKFVGLFFHTEMPARLRQKLPKVDIAYQETRNYDERAMRVVVIAVEKGEILVTPTTHPTEPPLRLKLSASDEKGDFSYLLQWLRPNSQLNLLETKIKGEEIIAAQVIYEPDYLVDVTAIAACFQGFGISPDLHAISRLQPKSNTTPIFLGNFASQLLDEAIHGLPLNYPESIMRFFKHNALQFVACEELENEDERRRFHQQAQQQQQNLYAMVEQQLRDELKVDGQKDILLEPSFFCEMLGVQGRMDFLSRDFTVVVEQKSGKKDFQTKREVLAHRVQMTLYIAMLHYAFGKRYSELHPHLLYSKFAGKEGLLRIQNAPDLLRSALAIRNKIVHRELSFAERGAADFFQTFQPEQVHTIDCGRLWSDYKLPELTTFAHIFRHSSPLALSYFYRFHRFLSLEQRISKLGTSGREASGFASAWQSTIEEKQQAGNLLMRLRIDEHSINSTDEGGISQLRFFLPATHTDDLLATPNFRVGDIVVAYPYSEKSQPDMRADMVFRASIAAMDAETLTLRLRAPQSNAEVFRPQHALWAIEPDLLESSNNALFRGLFALLTGNEGRRQLLLNQRPAHVEPSLQPQLHFENDETNLLVRKVLQARDIFLLVGPPGTGKTSVGLMSILREELTKPQQHVLLAAFTNRAVDEICSKLVKAGLDFLRVGNRLTCDAQYVPYLLEEKIGRLQKLNEVEQMLRQAQIVVGTTASLSANTALFKLNRFSLAIIDEASQLLEPHLLPLLMAEHDGALAIDRFVLIGDHKQLPAVVQQSERESEVDDEILRSIGLTNCRRSLFERMIATLPESCIHRFHRQGRMHPEVARFANIHFYNSQLLPIPLPHQEEESPHPRMEFYPCVPEETDVLSAKTNPAEAQLIAQLCLRTAQEAIAQKGNFDAQQDLGVIVPYRHQIALVRQELQTLPLTTLSDIAIDTVERFQGSERETIIYGFTVTRAGQLNFLCNSQFVDETGALIDRKLNVVLTRARQRTIIVGNPQLLATVPQFKALIDSITTPKITLSR